MKLITKIVLFTTVSVLIIACENHAIPDFKAKTGDTVYVHYTGSLPDGEVFETTSNEEARDIIIGQQDVLPAFENALIGMQIGEKKTFTVPSAEAFGPYRDDPGMTFTMDRNSLAHTIDPVVGMQLNAAVFLPDKPSDQPSMVPVTVTQVTDSTLTVDANHPLAGKDLKFEVEIVNIKPAELH